MEKKNGCWNKNGVGKNGEKKKGCWNKNGLKKDSEKKNPFEKNGEKKNGGCKKNGLEKNGEKNRRREKKNLLGRNGENKNGRVEKKRLDRNGENDREERRTRELGTTNRGMPPKWLLASTSADLKGGRGTSGLILRDPKGARGTIEALPAILKGGGRGTNRLARCVVGWIFRAAIGGDDSTACSRVNAPGDSGSEPSCRATSEPGSRRDPLVNELLGTA